MLIDISIQISNVSKLPETVNTIMGDNSRTNAFMGDNSRTNALMEIPEILLVHCIEIDGLEKKYVNRIGRKCDSEHRFFFIPDGISWINRLF